jgi:hypothetical protein
MSLTLGCFKRRTGDAARALERTAGGTPRAELGLKLINPNGGN